MDGTWVDAEAQLRRLDASLGLGLDLGAATITGTEPVLAARYPLASSAAAVLAAVGLTAARCWELRGGPTQRVAVDTRHAGALMRGFYDQEIDGGVLDPDPTQRLALARLYRAADGRWLQLYGVTAPLDTRTLEVLGCATADPDRVVVAVARRPALDWEDALSAAGAPGAMVRTRAEWAEHPQARLLGAQPLVRIERVGDAPVPPPPVIATRPLAGVRALDVCRMLAGPVCGRTLAEHGADVLALTTPGLAWIRRAMIDTSVGKRSAELDLRSVAGRERFDALLAQTDVFCENARPGRMARLGLGMEELMARRPGLIHVSIDGWGPDGPWRDRAGFEALTHAALGVTAEHLDEAFPRPIPALPGDHLSGYLAALGVLCALVRRQATGGSWHVHVSLARTVGWLQEHGDGLDPARALDLSVSATNDLRVTVPGGFGSVRQLRPAPSMSLTPPRWERGAVLPGSDAPGFPARTTIG